MRNILKALSFLYEVTFTVVHISPTPEALRKSEQPACIYSNVADVVRVVRHDLEFKKWTVIFIHRRFTEDEVIHITQQANWLQLSRWIFAGDSLVDFENRSDAFLVRCISFAHDALTGILDIPSGYRDCNSRRKVNLTAANAGALLERMNFIKRLVVVCRSNCWDFDEFQEIVHALTGYPPATLLVNSKQPAQQESEEVFHKLRTRQGDLVLTRHVFSEDRLGQVGYSIVSSFSQNQFVTKRMPPHRMGSFGLVSIFDSYCWMTLLAIALAFTFIANLKIHDIASAALQVLGCLLQVGIVIHKKRNASLYITMLLGSILIAQVFRTKLLSSFNIPTYNSITTIADLIKVLEKGKVHICTFEKDFIASVITVKANLRVLRLLAKVKQSRKLYEASREKCVHRTAHNDKIISIMSSAEIFATNYSHLVDISSQAIVEQVSGFLISPGHPYSRRFNRIVLQMLDMNLFIRIQTRSLLRSKIRTLLQQQHSSYVNRLKLLDVAFALLILTAGLLLAWIVFCVEYCRGAYTKISPLDADS